MAVVRHKEAIHSGHFMVSDFEAEAEDEEDMIAVPPSTAEEGSMPQLMTELEPEEPPMPPGLKLKEPSPPPAFVPGKDGLNQRLIDVSLNKLFRSMSIAYRHRLTSPKWNRFRGLKLRWKDKIRLNNVIWRCWHMQFIRGSNRLLCAFANPLEIDNHNRTEGSTLLEGKYWKRKLQAITKEYQRWRMFYKNRGTEEGEITDQQWDLIFQSPFQLQVLGGSKDDAALDSMDPGEDFLMDALFGNHDGSHHGQGGCGTATVALQFPVPREVYKSMTNADFIQPGLVQLQPSLDDFFMDLDQQPDWILSRLPSILESSDESNSQIIGPQQQQSGVQESQDSKSGQELVMPTSGFAMQQQTNAPASSNMLALSSYSLDLQQQQQQPQQPQPPPRNTHALPKVQEQSSAFLQPQPQANAQVMPKVQQQSAAFLSPQQQQQPEQSQRQSAQATVMDLASAALALQQQQTEPEGSRCSYAYSNSSSNIYPPPSYGLPQKRISPPPRCAKRHSPKHRILHHRYDLSSSSADLRLDAAPLKTSENTVGLHQPTSPYKLPVNQQSVEQQQQQFLEHRMKSRNLSGPSNMQQCNTGSSRNVYSNNPMSQDVVSNSYSELVQLLKTNKTEAARQQSHPGLQQLILLQEQPHHHRNLQQQQQGRQQQPPQQQQRDVDKTMKTETLDMSAIRPLTLQEKPAESFSYDAYPENLRKARSKVVEDGEGQQRLLDLSLSPRPPIRKTLKVVLSARPIPPPPPRDQPTSAPAAATVDHNTKISGAADRGQFNAGQKRHGSIKNGFDHLRSLIPSLNSSIKISKAALLHKGGDYLVQLKSERQHLAEEIASHRAKIEGLNDAITRLHKVMDGAAVTVDTYDQLEKLFDDHVLSCTRQNWKYWAFSLFAHPLLSSYQTSVDGGSFEEMQRTAINWVDQHLNLSQLRPILLKAMTEVSKRTDIITGGGNLPDQALAEAVQGSRAARTKQENAFSPKFEPIQEEDPSYPE